MQLEIAFAPAAKAIFDQIPHWRKEMSVHRPSRGIESRLWQQGGGYDRNIVNLRTAAHVINYIH
ncbi:MAG TPA: hypothetical protein PKA27_16590 [Fimbriimonadaceae bacterium]|nr:hypothetical protein [Fimbriimonadaceae bacterium]